MNEDVFRKSKLNFSKIEKDEELMLLLNKIILLDPSSKSLSIFYQYFISKKFRQNSGKFFTPEHIAEIMVNLVPVKKNAVIMDPACGSGSFLIAAGKRSNNFTAYCLLRLVADGKDAILPS